MKKLLSMVSAAALAATCFAVPAFAAESAAISVSSDSGVAGAEVAVNVSISGNDNGFVSYDMELDYDSSALELTGITAGEKSPGMFVGEVSTGKAGYISSDKISGDGVLFSATFKIKEGASGDQGVSVKNVNVTDENYSNVAASFPVSVGTVTVTVPVDPENPTTPDGTEGPGDADGSGSEGAGDTDSSEGTEGSGNAGSAEDSEGAGNQQGSEDSDAPAAPTTPADPAAPEGDSNVSDTPSSGNAGSSASATVDGGLSKTGDSAAAAAFASAAVVALGAAGFVAYKRRNAA